MTDTPAAAEIPVYEDDDERDRQYRAAQADGEPYLAVEQPAPGEYAVTFDLLPAGARLDAAGRAALRERLVEDVETLVGDETEATAEVSHSLSDSLGSVSGFATAAVARDVAETVATVVLDRSNWAAERSDDASPSDRRTN